MVLKSPIFIGGAGRSGTSLVRVILNSHPHICCGPEFKLLPNIAELWTTGIKVGPVLKSYHLGLEGWSSRFRDFVSSLLEPALLASGKRRLAEKTPNNVLYFYQLSQIFPDALFIHMIRDGRDVVSSLRKMDWVDANREKNPYADTRAAAMYWVKAVSDGLSVSEHIPAGRIYQMRYEDLIEKPEPQLRALFQFLQEPWDSQVMNFHQKEHQYDDPLQAEQVSQDFYKSSKGRWRQDLNEKDLQLMNEVAGPLLAKLGYNS